MWELLDDIERSTKKKKIVGGAGETGLTGAEQGKTMLRKREKQIRQSAKPVPQTQIEKRKITSSFKPCI